MVSKNAMEIFHLLVNSSVGGWPSCFVATSSEKVPSPWSQAGDYPA
jgi:hypothetical protein